MRYEALIAAVLVLSQVGAAPANAEPRDTAASQVNAPSPQFSAAETLIVGQNELLRELIATDPWLVRHILDAVAERSANGEAFDADAFVSTAFYTGGAGTETKTATASVELIELLRRVKDEKADKQGSKQSSGRSAKGSVELLESLKKAKKEKGGGK